MRSANPLCLLLALFTATAFTWTAAPQAVAEEGAAEMVPSLDFDTLFSDPRPASGPSNLHWNHDGSRLTYLQPADDGSDEAVLWSLDMSTGESTKLFGPEVLTQAGAGDGASLSGYEHFPAEDALLVQRGGDLYRIELPGGKAKRLTETEADEEVVTLSPDGSQVAYVREANLYVLDLASGKEKALTTDGKVDHRLNGITDWVYWEEIWGRNPTSFWWSPDGSKIAFYQFEEDGVGRYPLVDYGSVYPEIEWQRYPKTGTDNPKVRLGVVTVADGDVTWLETESDEETYIARVAWHPDSEKVAVQRLNRDQTRLDLLLCGADGKSCETLLTETHPTWLNLGNEFHYLSDGRFIWSSEKNGWRHLYLHGPDGKEIRPLSQGRWAVVSLDGVDEEKGWVIFTGHSAPGAGAARRRVYRSLLEKDAVDGLTGDQGWNSIQPAPGMNGWLHTFSTANQPTRRIVLNGEGRRVKELTATPLPDLDPKTLPQWEIVTLWKSDGTKLLGRVMKPAGFDPAKKYPAIMYHYGGPGSQVVVDRWSWRARDLWHKMMAERGYVVLSVDNEGSVFFGKYGEDKQHKRFGEINLKAQQAGIDYLKTLGYVDPNRVGLWGGSGGGTNTLYCMLNSPGTWAAGVAFAPVTDWRLYDTIWTERYFETPEANPDGYRDSSPITYADQLADPILIVHGTADDNVHPQNTYNMVDAWVKAGVPFEMALYPGQKHSFSGASERHFYERMTEFFDRHLAEGAARAKQEKKGAEAEPEGTVAP